MQKKPTLIKKFWSISTKVKFWILHYVIFNHITDMNDFFVWTQKLLFSINESWIEWNPHLFQVIMFLKINFHIYISKVHIMTQWWSIICVVRVWFSITYISIPSKRLFEKKYTWQVFTLGKRLPLPKLKFHEN